MELRIQYGIYSYEQKMIDELLNVGACIRSKVMVKIANLFELKLWSPLLANEDA